MTGLRLVIRRRIDAWEYCNADGLDSQSCLPVPCIGKFSRPSSKAVFLKADSKLFFGIESALGMFFDISFYYP